VCAEHGYLTGEQHTCPHCGKEAEVYSRITGYYRPVKNWNDGKSQEFQDRKVYNIAESKLTRTGAPVPKAEDVPNAGNTPVVAKNAKAILFSRVTCPNCRVAETLLNKAGFPFEKLIADENVELCKQYGIKGAPTLVITDGEAFESHYSVPEIKKYLANR